MKHQAREFATKAHQGQSRKSSNAPYITHPIRVAERLEQEGFSNELVCAAYLHDVVEDTPYEIEDIEEIFGEKIAHLVTAHTEDKTKSWTERKQHTIETVGEAEKEIKYLIVADRLDNLLDMKKELKQKGHAIWEHFNAGFEKQKWYHVSIAENMYAGLDSAAVPDFFAEFAETVERVFG